MTEPARVLVVDDDDTFRELIAAEIGARGFSPTTAASAQAAIAVAGREELAVALVDLRLPDASGLEVLRRLRELQPAAEVIVLTGHGSIETAIEAMRLGAFDYLRKPCPIEELEVTLQKALERLNTRFARSKRFAPAALAALQRHRWPGNVRELLHAVERAVVLSPTDEMDVAHLPPELRAPAAAHAADGEALPTLEELERRHIERVLSVVSGNRARAAKILGLSERRLYRKVKEYGLAEG